MFIAAVAVALALVEAFFDAVDVGRARCSCDLWSAADAAALTRSRRLLWALTAALTIATFALYAVQIPAGAFALSETFFVNRLFDALEEPGPDENPIVVSTDVEPGALAARTLAELRIEAPAP